MKVFFVTSIAVGLFLLIGCSAADTPQPGPVTHAKDIVGIWEGGGNIGQYFVQYNEDGTVRFATTPGNLADRPRAIGEFWFEDGRYYETAIEVHNLPPCGNAPGVYEVELLENGNIVFTEVEDECRPRASFRVSEHKRVE